MAPCVLALLMALATCTAHVAGAVPFEPERDDEVLETLPLATSPGARALRRLREELARGPARLDLALQLAWRYLELARATSDPRPAGWAEGVLGPWLARAEPPSEALLLRATLRQNRHEFAAALEDLDRVLARDPRNAQAWLTRAVILQVQGEPAAAGRSCRPLLALADTLSAATCLANAAGLAGRGRQALAMLERALAAAGGSEPGVQLWAWTSLAELAARLGCDEAAERAFRAALAIERSDPYLLAARADYLLDRGRASEVAALLGEQTQADGLLLRLALAEQVLGAPELEAHVAALDARFAASRARGESLHAGEEARFALAFRGNVAEALRLASANFAVQREPRDARILLEAALAAGEPGAARPVLTWLGATSLEDVRLARLAAQVEGLR